MVMKRKNAEFGLLAISFAILLALGGCGKGQGDVAAQEAPPPSRSFRVSTSLFLRWNIQNSTRSSQPLDTKLRRNSSPQA